MSELIVNPEIPYVGNIPSGNLRPGKLCRIQGITLPHIDRFNINLQTGPNFNPRDDTALHISVRINQGYIARNSYVSGEWGREEDTGKLTICAAQSFEILILTDINNYKVAVNGEHFCDFSHRIPFDNVSHLLIDGDVNITLISWELSVPLVQGQPPSQLSQLNVDSSQQLHSGQNFQPNAYQPQGSYNVPGGQYGPPPPPGVQPQGESQFGSIFEQAQEALVGAIKSGAAEKLLGGLLSSGEKQGYPPQNAQYGIYPQLPSDNDLVRPDSEKVQNSGPLEKLFSGLLNIDTGNNANQQSPHVRPEAENSHWNNQGRANIDVENYGQYPAAPTAQQSKGPLESFLSGFLSPAPNQQAQPHQPNLPQVGGEGSIGGLGSMGGILSSLAGQILHNPTGDNRQK